MEDPALYRKYAEECKTLASTMLAAERTVMLEIAGAWLGCAKDAEKRAAAKNVPQVGDPRL